MSGMISGLLGPAQDKRGKRGRRISEKKACRQPALGQNREEDYATDPRFVSQR
jgi:hypothetical protein